MQLAKTNKIFYYILSLCTLMLFLLGGWWLYLVFKLASKLTALNHPILEGNLVSMIQWEGITFFLFLMVLIIALLYFHYQDHKKTKSLHAFFASLTHELKTPLASMRLQSEFLTEIIDTEVTDIKLKDKLNIYTRRLNNDNIRLEDQLDNHLHLSRVERNAPLNLRAIDLKSFLEQEILRYNKKIQFEIDYQSQSTQINADDFALQTIFRNLIENSITHIKHDTKTIKITVFENHLTYQDNGSDFKGDLSKLGNLFYKFDSPKGSGIGLYLIRKLCHKMNIKLNISATPGLCFHFSWPSPSEKASA